MVLPQNIIARPRHARYMKSPETAFAAIALLRLRLQQPIPLLLQPDFKGD